MVTSELAALIEQVERLLASAELSQQVEEAVRLLLNAVEALSADNQSKAEEIARLRQQLEQKKRDQNTSGSESKTKTNHSSEEQRKKLAKPEKPPRNGPDHRTFKPLEIHEVRTCPIDPTTLPPDAIQLADEIKIVQGIKLEPHNIRFHQERFYSPSENKFYLGPLPAGYDCGAFGADLRAVIIALKYCGNMSEPKIAELLWNFKIEVSSGSISNILTNSANEFEADYRDLLIAGLASTIYVQIDDTSARVNGAFWHTHIVCNPFYTFYSTQPHKDRMTVLAVLQGLQNMSDLHFQCDAEMLQLLQEELLDVPEKWLANLVALGDVTMTSLQLKTLLNYWFGSGNNQLRTAIEQAAAMVFYRHQTDVPRPLVLVSDGAKQFEHITLHWQQCWIHDGRHYEKLSPVVTNHVKALAEFQTRYWTYYKWLQDYRAGPTPALAEILRTEFDSIFATRTGYAALDDRIARTQAKRAELLTVLEHPTVPLHNNASELGARVSARRRDVSLHSKGVRGARAMDIFTTLVQTAKKLGLSAYHYLRARLTNPSAPSLLVQLLRSTTASA